MNDWLSVMSGYTTPEPTDGRAAVHHDDARAPCDTATPPGAQCPVNAKETRMDIKRHQVGPRMSQAVVHNNTVYLAGQVASDSAADDKGQTEQILKKIDEAL